jgi:hypothetical protein
MKIDRQKFVDLYKREYGALTDTRASALDALLGFLEQDGDVGDLRWGAYVLATVKHECADTWQPIEEFGRGQGEPYGKPVSVTGSDGKTYVNAFYGRGYVQLTWERNYQNMSRELNLGDELLIHPERALHPPVSYRVLSFGMRNGSFTGVGLSNFINGSRCDYLNARRIVNGLDRAELIASYARTLERLLKESVAGEDPGARQDQIVNAPDRANAA